MNNKVKIVKLDEYDLNIIYSLLANYLEMMFEGNLENTLYFIKVDDLKYRIGKEMEK